MSEARQRMLNYNSSSIFGETENTSRCVKRPQSSDLSRRYNRDPLQSNFAQERNSNFRNYDEFVPQYDSKTPMQRYLKEFYNQENYQKYQDYPQDSQILTSMSPWQRKQYQLNSNILHSKQEKDLPQQKPLRQKERRVQTPSSYNYHKKQSSLTPNDQNFQKRRENQMFSDLFGREADYDSSFHQQLSSKHLNDGYNVQGLFNLPQYPYPETNRQPSNEYRLTAHDIKIRNQSSVLQNIQDYSSCQTPQVQQYKLKRIPQYEDDQSIKDVCSSLHIVDLQIENDPLTGQHKGRGLLKIRSSNSQNVNKALRQLQGLGIQVQQKNDNLAAKPKKILRDKPRTQSREGYSARQFKREQLDRSSIF